MSFWHHLLCKFGVHEWEEWSDRHGKDFRYCQCCYKCQELVEVTKIIRFGLPPDIHLAIVEGMEWRDIED